MVVVVILMLMFSCHQMQITHHRRLPGILIPRERITCAFLFRSFFESLGFFQMLSMTSNSGAALFTATLALCNANSLAALYLFLASLTTAFSALPFFRAFHVALSAAASGDDVFRGSLPSATASAVVPSANTVGGMWANSQASPLAQIPFFLKR